MPYLLPFFRTTFLNFELSFLFLHPLDGEDPSATAQAQLRKSVLNSLVETPKPSEDIPPARLPTKEEKELIKLSLSLENLKMQSQMQQQGLGESMMESTFNNNLTNTSSYATVPSASKVLAPLRSPGGVGKGGVGGGPSLKRGGLSPPRSRGECIVLYYLGLVCNCLKPEGCRLTRVQALSWYCMTNKCIFLHLSLLSTLRQWLPRWSCPVPCAGRQQQHLLRR